MSTEEKTAHRESTVAVDSNKQEAESSDETSSIKSAEKPIYKKPELRKYTQIDYVTAYGVD